MAASLLRLGRLGSLKCIQQEGWSSLRIPCTAAFSSKAQDPEKPAKKAKSSSKSLEASEERASLLAYKTAVAFPTRLSTSGFVSSGVALGESEPSTKPFTTAESVVTAGGSAQTTPQVTDEPPGKGEVEHPETIPDANAGQAEIVPPEAPATGSVAPVEDAVASGSVTQKEQEDSSSSSSSSESDSDSDSDDEKPDKPEKTGTVTVPEEKPGQEKVQKIVGEESVSKMKTTESPAEGETAKGIKPKKIFEESPEDPDTVMEAPVKEAPPPSSATANAEEIADPALSTTIANEVPFKTPDESHLASASEVQTETPEINNEVTPEAGPKVDAVLTEACTQETADAENEAPDSAKDVPSEVKTAPDSVAKDPAKVHAEIDTEAPTKEELLDPAPVIADAAEPASETEVATATQEPAPKPEPEPESFDNTTYKNLQHHSYHAYTFVDMDVEMAKHRLPQPSSGRPSPRH